MAKLSIIFTLVCFSTLIANSSSLFQTTIPPFRVYQTGIASGPNANIFEVARSNISTNATSFGIVYVGDTILRAGPDPNSQMLGRNQGTATTTGLFEPSEVVSFNFLFTNGKYKGSSLKVSGQRLVFKKDQEIPIDGGTGFFRGARGYTIYNFISYNPTTDTYFFMYDFYVTRVGIFG